MNPDPHTSGTNHQLNLDWQSCTTSDSDYCPCWGANNDVPMQQSEDLYWDSPNNPNTGTCLPYFEALDTTFDDLIRSTAAVTGYSATYMLMVLLVTAVLVL